MDTNHADPGIRFELDELDWVIGEIEHAVSEASKRGKLLYEYDPQLARAALDFFRRFHKQLDLGQPKFNFGTLQLAVGAPNQGPG